MGTAFWIRRFLTVLAGAFALIAGVQWLKGHPLEYALGQGALWGIVSAAVFTGANVYRWRRGQRCAICGDPPDPRAAQPDRPA